MEELLALARDCTVTISFTEGGNYRFEARRRIGDKEFGIAGLVSADDAALANTCIASRRLKEMRHSMGLADAAV